MTVEPADYIPVMVALGIPRNSVGVVQLVTIIVDLTLGVCKRRPGCSGTRFTCDSLRLEYTSSFVETLENPRDNQSVQVYSEYSRHLLEVCGKTLQDVYDCCPYSYSYKVRKDATVGYSPGGNHAYHLRKKARYECSPTDIREDGNPPINPRTMPRLHHDPTAVSFSSSPVVDVWRSVFSLAITHPQCGDIEIETEWPGYL